LFSIIKSEVYILIIEYQTNLFLKENCMRYGNKSLCSYNSVAKAALEVYKKQLESVEQTADVIWKLRQVEVAIEMNKERVTPPMMAQTGGAWLRTVREWMQTEFLNGEDVTWGSEDILSQRRNLTPRDLEWLAAKIASAAVNEDRE
jgi:hypothetical protein